MVKDVVPPIFLTRPGVNCVQYCLLAVRSYAYSTVKRNGGLKREAGNEKDRHVPKLRF